MNPASIQEAVDNAPKFVPLRPKTAITAAALLEKEVPLPIEFISGRIPAGLVIIAGRPKCKKSWFALQAAIAAVSGREFMGGTPTPGSALFLALEDNQPRMRERLKVLGADKLPTEAMAQLDLRFEWPRGENGVRALSE